MDADATQPRIRHGHNELTDIFPCYLFIDQFAGFAFRVFLGKGIHQMLGNGDCPRVQPVVQRIKTAGFGVFPQKIKHIFNRPEKIPPFPSKPADYDGARTRVFFLFLTETKRRKLRFIDDRANMSN